MLFNSLEFAVFFPLVCALYFTAPARLRVPILLVSSCVFYMAFIPVYIFILFVTIGIDYVAGLMLERAQGQPRRRTILLVSIIGAIGVVLSA
jgi:D-alanyl-lipoteichoic acid acyltransferase DltB (MBOAT superfamily)